MLVCYRISDTLTIGPPWLRLLVSRAPAGVLLRTSRTFPPAHPTTKMCLRLMLDVSRTRRIRTLVDVGCGCGILALAGLKLGVEQAVGIDLSTQAIAASRANAELNELERRLLLVRGSTEALAAAFDLVVANLPMPMLVAKASELLRLAGFWAPLIFSGFHDLDRRALERLLRRYRYRPIRWLSADLSFSDPPPSGSYTWMAVLADARPDLCPDSDGKPTAP